MRACEQHCGNCAFLDSTNDDVPVCTKDNRAMHLYYWGVGCWEKKEGE
jgi:hypothetical protein